MANFEYDSSIDLNNMPLSVTEIENLLPHWQTKIMEVFRYKNKNVVEMVFLVAAKNETEIKRWVKEYEEKSKCSYSIRSSQKCSGVRVAYKQRLNCHHNTGNTNLYDPLVSTKRTKNTNCPSAMSITLRSVNKRYQGKDKSKAPNPEMPCEIKLIPDHNHSVGGSDLSRFKPVSEETKRKLLELFECGHSPHSAHESIIMDIQLQHENFEEMLADRSLCPSYLYCYHLYTSTFKEKYSPAEGSREFLEHTINEFNNDNDNDSARIEFVDDDYVICLCPPLSKRINENIEAASDIVYLDAAGTVDHDGNHIFILSTVSDCGALPLCVLITSSESCDLLSAGFQLFKDIMGQTIFSGSVSGPKIFMTDDLAMEQDAIYSAWPKSTNLLCVFYVLRSVWRWLSNSKNQIKADDQNTLYLQFRNILYADSDTECEASYQIAYVYCEMYPEYQKYLTQYWARRTLWAFCYRKELLRRDYYSNVSEAAMRLLMERIFDRTKGFNLVQMIDFFLTKFFCYYEKRLLDAAYNRVTSNVLHHSIKQPSVEIIERIQDLADALHVVPSSKNPNLLFVVNSEILLCTCVHSRAGNMCKHIYSVCFFIHSEKFIKVIDNYTVRKNFFYIATGKQPRSSWHVEVPDGETPSQDQIEVMSDTEITESHIEYIIIDNATNGTRQDEDPLVLKGSSIISEIAEKLSEHLKQSPLEVCKALETFNEKLDKSKTVSEFTSFLCSSAVAVGKRKIAVSDTKNSVGGPSMKRAILAKKPDSTSDISSILLEHTYTATET